MIQIIIEQLDSNDETYRTFTRHIKPSHLDITLDSIRRAYNLDHTRVTIDGKSWVEGIH